MCIGFLSMYATRKNGTIFGAKQKYILSRPTNRPSHIFFGIVCVCVCVYVVENVLWIWYMIQNPFGSHNAVVRWEFSTTHRKQRIERKRKKSKDSRKLYLFVMVYLWSRVGKHNSFGCDDSLRIQFEYSTDTHTCARFILYEQLLRWSTYIHLLWSHIDNESVNLKNVIYEQSRTINACDVHWHAHPLLHCSI